MGQESSGGEDSKCGRSRRARQTVCENRTADGAVRRNRRVLRRISSRSPEPPLDASTLVCPTRLGGAAPLARRCVLHSRSRRVGRLAGRRVARTDHHADRHESGARRLHRGTSIHEEVHGRWRIADGNRRRIVRKRDAAHLRRAEQRAAAIARAALSTGHQSPNGRRGHCAGHRLHIASAVRRPVASQSATKTATITVSYAVTLPSGSVVTTQGSAVVTVTP